MEDPIWYICVVIVTACMHLVWTSLCREISYIRVATKHASRVLLRLIKVTAETELG